MASDPNPPPPANQANGSNGDSVTATNPYETAAELIPKDDPFLQQNPQYGRYAPRDADFKPRYHRWWQADADAFAYWEGVVKSSCTPENSLNVSGAREAYATGSIIIHVDHDRDMSDVGDKYSYVNANELSAARKAEEPLKELGIAVPLIYFCGTIDGKNVTVESRIPGVSLEVAWRYLTAGQIASFKEQCRRVLKCLAGIDPAPDQPSYVCSGLNPQSPPGVETLERGILFGEKDDEILFLVHNNMTISNIIVNDDKIVGILGWRHSGYFGFERASKIHRQFRMQASTFANGASEGMQSWADLYEGLPKADGDQSISAKDAIAPQVKTEPASMNLDKVPLTEETESKSFAQLDGTEDHPTQKNIANLKHGGASRASSSDRSSPAPSTKLGSMGRKSTPGGTKKAPAKKAAPKKRKINDEDNESVDGGRSNTPSSLRTSKAPSAKKQGSASIASSPAPESKKKVGKKGNKKASTKEESEEDDDNEVFCICRKPDNHTWMIGCDGECEDWFHGKCVNIDPRDADLIEKYICPNCHAKGKGQTTWKPICRVEGCRKPARFTKKPPSKYCSDEHGREFMRSRTRRLKKGQADDLGSRGGVLTAGELKAVVMGVSSAQEFRKLGERIISPPPEEEDPETGEKAQKKLGLDADIDGLVYSPDEASKIQELRTRRDDLLHRKEMLAARDHFLNLVRQRSKAVLEKLKQSDPKGGWKDICGFDSRLAWSDEEFDEWRLSEIGKNALQTGTPEALASSHPDATDADGDTIMDESKADEDDLASVTRGVCTKKRCERHKQWVKVQQQELLFEQDTLKEDLVQCEKEAQNVVERAVLRMWAEKDNAQIGNP
ncbi:putative PHD transcription factor [Aspergillus terreus]|uniref:Putative PHD transcription factor n=1 Tax=Aspergillus terreus TaxID=33178 RepID=A0A5M3YRH5_ASPTE|nr:hypothetical protein ATETN484_0002076400 [Aspergillus terreus]GFF15620.1 putative PHD transcription factor [Aspergillus terreus]